MASALRMMGVDIELESDVEFIVSGSGKLHAPREPLFLGNAGTAMRFLTAAAVLADGPVTLDGDDHMRRRPIEPLVAALRSLGCDLTAQAGCPPLEVKAAGGFPGNSVMIDANLSSQYASALLMIAPCGNQPVDIFLGSPKIGGAGYLGLTLDIMARFGAEITTLRDGAWRIRPTGYRATNYVVEPDASSCTYFWAAEALTHGKIDLGDVTHSTQPDAKALEFIRAYPNMPSEIDGSQMQDAVPTLAVLAAFNRNPVKFVGIANLRVKECDRISAIAIGLNQICPGLAIEMGDQLSVTGSPDLIGSSSPAVIDTHNDHRMAMSFSLAGLVIRKIVIDNPSCVSKTFPGYWEALQSVGAHVKSPS